MAFSFFDSLNAPQQQVQSEDPYAGIERLMQQHGATQYQGGPVPDGYGFARPYANTPPTNGASSWLLGSMGIDPRGPQPGWWMMPSDQYRQINPQTSGGGFLNDGFGGFLKDTADFGKTIASGPGPVLGAAAGVGALSGAGLIPAGEGLVTQGAANSAGGGMWDWLDQYAPSNFQGGSSDFFSPDYSQQFATNPGANPSNLWNSSSGSLFGPNAFDPSSSLYNTVPGASGVGPTGVSAIDAPGQVMNLNGGGMIPGASSGGFFDTLRNAASLKSLFGGSPINLNGLSPTGAGGRSSGGGILDTVMNDPMGAAFNATPFLLALNEANKQGGDINNVLGSINSDSYRRAVLNPYNQDTATGRTSLMNDQEMRGVRGSSFGDQSLNSYDYTRALGAGDLSSKASMATAGLQGSLINSRNTNRNLLLGAGLNASGKLFAPQQDPFGLRALMGIG